MKIPYIVLILCMRVNAWIWTPQTLKIMNKKVPIVFAAECDHLRKTLTATSNGQELLYIYENPVKECNPDKIRDGLRLLLQTTTVLMYSSGLPITQIDTGHFNQSNPNIIESHNTLVESLNMIRGFLQGGYTELYNMDNWNFTQSNIYNNVVFHMKKCFNMIKHHFRIDRYFIGHQLLFLPYEETMKRKDSMSELMYATSGHLLWLDKYTNENIQFLKNIQNPVGIQVNDNYKFHDLKNIIKNLNPNNDFGKIILITRMRSNTLLKFIKDIQNMDLNVCWCADFRNIRNKNYIQNIFNIHKKTKTWTGIWLQPDLDKIFFIGDCISRCK